MRNYGSVHTCFWENTGNKALSDQAKLLALYLLTGPHSNMLGSFRLPDGYVTEDLKWNLLEVKKSFNELTKINFITRDENTGWLVIHDFLKWNPIQNPKQGVAIKKLLYLIPDRAIVWRPLVKSLRMYGKYLDKCLLEGLPTLSNCEGNHEIEYGNSMETLFPDINTDQEKKQDQKQNQKQNQDLIKSMSGKPDVDNQNIIYKLNKGALFHKAEEVLNFLNEKTGKAFRPVPSNLNLILARLKSGVSVVECRQVIAKKTRDWSKDSKMATYLRPATLFDALKFEQYMGELVQEQGVIKNEIR